MFVLKRRPFEIDYISVKNIFTAITIGNEKKITTRERIQPFVFVTDNEQLDCKLIPWAPTQSEIY